MKTKLYSLKYLAYSFFSKQWHLWRGFLHLITDFMDAMEDEYEFKLLELYMRNEQEKDSKRKRKYGRPLTNFGFNKIYRENA